MTETTSQNPPTPRPPEPGGDGFDRLRALGIARPAERRWVGGVAAGLARRWNVDPLLVRGIFVALTIVSGIGLLVYGLAWALLPEDDGRIHLQSATRGDVTAGLVGAGIFVLLFLGIGGPDNGPGPIWWGFPGLVIVALVGIGVWWWATRSKSAAVPPGSTGYAGQPGGYPAAYGYPTGYPAPRPQGAPYTGGPAYGTPPPFPPRPPIPPQPPRQPKNRRNPATAASHRITRITLGLAVLAVATVVILERSAGIAANATVIALAAALGIIGLGIVVAGALGRRSGGLAPIGVLVAIALAIATAVAAADLRSADRISVVGDRDWRPTTAEAATLDYNLGVGDGTLWLTDPGILTTRQGTEPVRAMAQVGAGTLTVVVPDDVAVEVHADIAGGQLVRPDDSRRRFDGARDDDTPEIVRTGPAGAPVMIVDARVGFGEIVIDTATSTRLVTPSAAPTATPSVTPAASVPAATPAVPAPTTTPEVTP